MVKQMKILKLVVLLFGIISCGTITHVSAASINLICTEKGGTEKNVNRNGEVEKPISDFWSIPVSVDTVSNRATVYGKTRDLSVKPDKLNIQEFTTERKSNINSTYINVLIIDRKTLGFTYAWNSSMNYQTVVGLMTSTTTRKSHGNCTKVNAIKGNKI